jgi:hypothetical protein
MRYVVLVLESGRAPYSQIIDINLPGSYLLEAAAMHGFGWGAAGLRMYDLALCLTICISAVLLSDRGWRNRACGALAGLFFWLIHLQDGVAQGGQRDLAMAMLALVACVALLASDRIHPLARICTFELLVGCSLTIKPTLLPLAFLPLFAIRRSGEPLKRHLIPCGLGLLSFSAAPLGALAWLVRRHAVRAFLVSLSLVRELHAGIAHKTAWFLLVHSVSPVGLLIVGGLVLGAYGGAMREAHSRVLLYGAGCGLISYLVQAKGFPYQRYPFLLFAILLTFRFVSRALGAWRGTQIIAASSLILVSLGFAIHFASMVSGFDTTSPFNAALADDLTLRHAGQGEVQCLDTVGGCIATLYNLRLTQSTGYLYDCYAYEGSTAARNLYRSAFLTALEAAHPKYLVLTSQFCLSATGNINRIHSWPGLNQFVEACYRPDGVWQTEKSLRWWNRPEMPPSYEIYRRSDCLPLRNEHMAALQSR